MELSGLGIKLRRLQHSDIEMVRQYRNSPEIQKYMEFRDHINQEQQEKWFRSIDNEFNFFFVIVWEGKEVGLISGSNMNWETFETGNGGIFLWDPEVRETQIPLAAALLLTDFSWIIGIKKIHARILKDNHRAISFNRSLGYELQPGQEEIYNQHYVLTKESFSQNGAKLIDILARKHDSVYTLTLSDLKDPASAAFAELCSNIDEDRRKRLQLVLR